VVAGELRGRVTIDDASRGGVEVLALPFESPLEEARREARGKPAPEPIARALSGDDGQFRMALPEGIDVGGVSLVFGADGLIGSRLVRVFGPEDVEDVGNVTLAEGRSLAGTVVDPSGGPVVGARVTLWAGWFDFGPATFVAAFRRSPSPTTVTTGPDGRFRFADAARQQNRLRIEALGFGTVELRGLPEGALRKPVALAPGRSISGVVLLPDGRRPAAGAVVRFEGSGASPWVEARPDGAFLLEDLSAEPGALVADAGPDGRAEVQLGRDQVEARIVLSQPGRLHGRILDVLAERPVAGVRVLALDGDDTYLGVSAASGAFEIAGLPARHYRLRVEDPRFVPWSRDDLALSVGETTTQDIPLTRGAGLELLVVDEYGAPVADASVTLVRGGESGFRSFLSRLSDEGALRTDGGGRLQAERLTPGAGQSLTVRHEDYEAQTLGGIELSAGQTVRGLTVVLRRGLGIRGLVVDSEGSPVAGAQVRLSRNRRFGGRMSVVMSDRPRSEETGPDGSFEILGLSAEEYSLGVSKPSYVRVEMDSVQPVEPGIGEPLEITLRPGAALSGLVSTRSGEPRPGQMVIALPASADEGPARGGRSRSAWVQADEPSGPDGSFQIQGLEPGQHYDVQVLVDGAPTPALQGVAAPADGLMLTVSGYGGIRGLVVDEAGHPVPDFQVSTGPTRGGCACSSAAGRRAPASARAASPSTPRMAASSWRTSPRACARWRCSPTAISPDASRTSPWRRGGSPRASRCASPGDCGSGAGWWRDAPAGPWSTPRWRRLWRTTPASRSARSARAPTRRAAMPTAPSRSTASPPVPTR
jgi:protocatechuate 3,4-dioxygenase beta subunit